MKKLFLIILFGVFVKSLNAQDFTTKKEVLRKLQVANKYFMEKWPDPGKSIGTKKIYQSNIWTRGVYYEGLMALYNIDQKKAYYNYAIDWAEKNQWKPAKNNIYTTHADNQNCGMTYIDLYRIDKQPIRLKWIKENIDSVMNTHHYNYWTWIDAIQMAMPIYVKLGTTLNNTEYFDYMYKLYHQIKYVEAGNGLYNPEDQLWWRDKNFTPPYKEPNGEDCYWSRGNGWVFTALALVLDELPTSDPHYSEYLADFKSMAKALIPLQRKDGFWNVSLNDASHFGGKETSGTALFVYGMTWGVNHKVLEKSTYLPTIERGWGAINNEAIQQNGFLAYMQSTGKEPKDGQPVTVSKVPDFEDYGLGCVLLAGSEVYKLVDK